MPRRHRPPLTTREIAAYLAGSRLRSAWAEHWGPLSDWGTPSTDWVLSRLADEHRPVYASMKPERWWRFFWDGWAEKDK